MVDTQTSLDFKTACLKHELKSRLKRIEDGERKNNLNSQDYPWWWNERTNSNGWTGPYFQTKEDADKSFKRLYWKLKLRQDDTVYAEHSTVSSRKHARCSA